jgi:hypothetical protein
MNRNREVTPMLSPAHLAAQSARHATTSAADTIRRLGFRPAFLEFATMRIRPWRFADETHAQDYCLAGLPDEDLLLRLPSGQVVDAEAMLIAGFERGGFFYTRRAAARACEQWDVRSSGHSVPRLPPVS